MSSESNPTGLALKPWTEAREHAALLGPFDPIDLVGHLGDDVALAVLNALGEDCSEIVSGNDLLWQLNPDVRRTLLGTMAHSGRLAKVASVTSPPDEDALGKFLNATARGVLQIPGDASLKELDVLRTALQFTDQLGLDNIDATLVEREIAREETLEAQRLLLPNSLIGRDSQLRRMRAFSYDQDNDHDLIPWRAPVLLISGVGGSGKSALLAEFARRHRRRFSHDFPIVWFDFDRAALAAASVAELTLEFVRQLALAVPSYTAALEQFRKDLAERYDGELDMENVSFTVNVSRQSEIWSLWNSHGLGNLLRLTPLILVLDTIEEIMTRDDGRIDQLVRWIDALSYEGGMQGVRPILSGRSLDGQVGWSIGLRAIRIQLGDLTPISAARLLTKILVDAPIDLDGFPVWRLIDRYGGNPLTLKILARHLKVEGLDGANELLEGDDAPFRAELAQRYLYTRILGRIRTDDPDLVRIAHPGLVLRRVTPQIIRQVLAVPCGLGHIDQARADQLFQALSRQIWLVEEFAGDNAIRHRRDLRRLIIAAMGEDDLKAAREIHRAAMDYYTLCQDRSMTPHEQSIEAQYHRLFLSDADEIDGYELQMLAMALGEDVADLPAAHRARIKLNTGAPLEAEEIATLSAERAEDEFVSVSRRRLANSDPQSIPTPERAKTSERLRNPGISAEQAYVAGDIDALSYMGVNVIDEFVEEVMVETRKSRKLPNDFTDYAVWKVMLVSLGRPQQQWLSEHFKRRVESVEHRIEWSRPLDLNSKQSISVLTAMRMSMRLLGDVAPTYIDSRAADEEIRSDRVTKVEELRAGQLLVRDVPRRRYARINLALLCFLDGPFEQFLQHGHYEDRAGHLQIETSGPNLLDIFDRSQSRAPSLSVIQSIRLSRDFVIAEGQAFKVEKFRRLLRGMSPELYPLFQAAARQAPSDEIEAFTRLAVQRAGWPHELGREFRSLYGRDPARWAGTLIETADRFGMLAELATSLSKCPLGRALPTLLKEYDARLFDS